MLHSCGCTIGTWLPHGIAKRPTAYAGRHARALIACRQRERTWGTCWTGLLLKHPCMPRAQEMYDLVGLLLMIRINYHHQLIMNKRRIPCLDDYLDRTNLLLWPRFKVTRTTAHIPIFKQRHHFCPGTFSHCASCCNGCGASQASSMQWAPVLPGCVQHVAPEGTTKQ